jgi:glycosyltransferase involved in cell wall biosynthesis
MNHVPNRSVPRLLRDTDVVISLGRGAMEAMASGLPVLCAGYGYAGPITAANLPDLFERNLTAYGHHRDPGLVMADVRAALATPPGRMRALAERYFSVDASVDRLTSLARLEPIPVR